MVLVVIVVVGVVMVVVVEGILQMSNKRLEFLGFLWRFFKKSLG